MAVTAIHPPKIDESKFSLPIEKGGTSARSKEGAAASIGLVSYDQVDHQDGVALLSTGKTVQRKNYPLSIADTDLPVFFGDHSFYLDKQLVVQIANYNPDITYTIDQSGMAQSNVTMSGDQITLTSRNGGFGQQILRVNGREFHYEILQRKPITPTLVTPSSHAGNGHYVIDGEVPFQSQSFTTSAFVEPTGVLTHGYTIWQISTDANFAAITFSSSAAESKDSWTVANFAPYTKFYLRLAHVSTNGVRSDWSSVYEFMTAKMMIINTPSIVYPAAGEGGIPLQPTIRASAFSSIDFPGVHVATNWQIATDPNFLSIVYQSPTDGVNLTTWTIPNTLNYSGLYYVRCQYKADIAASNGSPYSAWSNGSSFTVMSDNREVSKPSVSVSGEMLANVQPVIYATPFSTINYNDTHVNSDWEISNDPSFSTLAGALYNSTTSKESWIPDVPLAYNTTFYARVRFKGAVKISPWSDAHQFKTVPAAVGLATVFGRNQTITKPAGVTQMRVEMVGGGGTGSNNTTFQDQYLGAPGTYVDSGWIDLTSAALTYSATIGQAGFESDPSFGDSGGDGGTTIFSGNGLNLIAAGGAARATLAASSSANAEVWNKPVNSAFPYPWVGQVVHPGNNFDSVFVDDPYAPGTYGRGGIAWFSGGEDGHYYANPGAVAVTFNVEHKPETPSVTVTTLSYTERQFTSSAFVQNDPFPNHVSTDWELSTDAGFSTISQSLYGDTDDKLNWTVGGLAYATTYYIRCRYNSRYTVSDWSPVASFQTVNGFVMDVVLSDTSNYILKNHALSLGWDGVTPLLANVRIPSGVSIYGSQSQFATPAFNTGTSFPAGTSITIHNEGVISGRPGQGAQTWGNNYPEFGYTALLIQCNGTVIINDGVIAGGGGGGGLGGGQHSPSSDAWHYATSGNQGGDAIVFTCNTAEVINNGTIGGGGGGGGGGGESGGYLGQGGSGGGGAGYGIAGNKPSQEGFGGEAGVNGTLTNGGAGGAGGSNSGGAGGKGGDLGQAGASGGNAAATGNWQGQPGGSAGRAVAGNKPGIIWTVPGTRLGNIA